MTNILASLAINSATSTVSRTPRSVIATFVGGRAGRQRKADSTALPRRHMDRQKNECKHVLRYPDSASGCRDIPPGQQWGYHQ